MSLHDEKRLETSLAGLQVQPENCPETSHAEAEADLEYASEDFSDHYSDDFEMFLETDEDISMTDDREHSRELEDQKPADLKPPLRELEEFKHSPLNLGRPSYRLLQLLPASAGHEISCKIFEAELHNREDAISYDALSYVWGSDKTSEDIEVDGKLLRVTENLCWALRRLRLAVDSTVLWIDAICIDQENFKEKGHQVQHMQHIYAQSQQVIVWLGGATRNSNLLMESLVRLQQRFHTEACHTWKLDDTRWHILWREVSNGTDDPTQPLVLEGLYDLLSRPWFKRIWVLQETANARAAVVRCGGNSVTACFFAIAPRLLGVTPTAHCQSVLDLLPGPSRATSWMAKRRDLYTLLRNFNQCDATQTKDLIFALLPLSSDAQDSHILRAEYEEMDETIIQKAFSFLYPFSDLNIDAVWKVLPHRTIPQFIQNLPKVDFEVLEQLVQNNRVSAAAHLLRNRVEWETLNRLDGDVLVTRCRQQMLHLLDHGHEVTPSINASTSVDDFFAALLTSLHTARHKRSHVLENSSGIIPFLLGQPQSGEGFFLPYRYGSVDFICALMDVMGSNPDLLSTHLRSFQLQSLQPGPLQPGPLQLGSHQPASFNRKDIMGEFFTIDPSLGPSLRQYVTHAHGLSFLNCPHWIKVKANTLLLELLLNGGGLREDFHWDFTSYIQGVIYQWKRLLIDVTHDPNLDETSVAGWKALVQIFLSFERFASEHRMLSVRGGDATFNIWERVASQRRAISVLQERVTAVSGQGNNRAKEMQDDLLLIGADVSSTP